MTRSANEVMTLAAKAARGAGAPPAQAAEFGRAAVCHLIAGRDVADLWTALEALPKGPILTLPLAFARFAQGAVDGVASGTVPGVSDVALAQSYADALPYANTSETGSEGLQLSLEISKPATRPKITRVDLPEDLAAWMKTLAARTFVPESEASRLAGAGAGLSDND